MPCVLPRRRIPKLLQDRRIVRKPQERHMILRRVDHHPRLIHLPLLEQRIEQLRGARDGVVGLGGVDAPAYAEPDVVGEILADGGQVDERGDVVRGELFGVANSGEHEDVRSGEGSCSEEDFFPCSQGSVRV